MGRRSERRPRLSSTNWPANSRRRIRRGTFTESLPPCYEGNNSPKLLTSGPARRSLPSTIAPTLLLRRSKRPADWPNHDRFGAPVSRPSSTAPGKIAIPRARGRRSKAMPGVLGGDPQRNLTAHGFPHPWMAVLQPAGRESDWGAPPTPDGCPRKRCAIILEVGGWVTISRYHSMPIFGGVVLKCRAHKNGHDRAREGPCNGPESWMYGPLPGKPSSVPRIIRNFSTIPRRRLQVRQPVDFPGPRPGCRGSEACSFAAEKRPLIPSPAGRCFAPRK